MCVGTEFGIIDTVAGCVEAIIFALLWYGFPYPLPWYVIAGFVISTLGWFVWAGYCFRFGARCQCQKIKN